jgi:SAM-dependent methyltransferase
LTKAWKGPPLIERSIYEFPGIFRRVHMEMPGEIEAEANFLTAVWRRHSRRPVKHVLDIACGDSPHGHLLARKNYTVAGIDRSPTMIAAGRRGTSGEGPVRFYRREIGRFSLPGPSFDAAFFMSETFPIMTGNRELISHLRSVAAILRPGGLYCVDIDRHDGIELVRRRQLWRSREVSTPEASVEVREYHRPISWSSGLNSIYELRCTIRMGERVIKTRDVIPVRYIVPSTLDLAAQASRVFKLIACYPDLSFTKPIERCYGRWLGVLRRL